MEIKLNTNISKEYENINVTINAPDRNSQVIELENNILGLSSNKIEKIIGKQDDNIYIIDINDIFLFYSEDKNNFCKTKDGVFRIKEKLYYLEEVLPSNMYIRTSNSAIVNINKVKCFNTNMVGSILIKLINGEEEYVSRRRIPEVMKFLKDRRR